MNSQELNHKGITAEYEAGEVGFSTLFIDVTIRTGTKRFEFYCPELDDIDRREDIKNDNSLINLNCDPDIYEEMLNWIESETIKSFYKDIVEKDYTNLSNYEIALKPDIKLYVSKKLVATGESEIEDYIAMIGR